MEVPHIIQQPQFKQHLSPKKREQLYKALKDQQKSILNQTVFITQDKSSHFIAGDGNESQIQGFSQHDGQHSNIKLDQEESQLLDNHSQSNTDSHQLQKISQPATKATTYLGQRQNRNSLMNNTVAAPMGFRGISEHQKSNSQFEPSKLSHYGQNIMANQTQFMGLQSHRRQQYLKKRQGNGGSPVPGLNDTSHISDEIAVPRKRDRTTVRIRTKNNQYLYNEGSFTQPISTKHNQSYLESSQLDLQERERVQALIAKYREEKIQRQIEKIEQEKLAIELERQHQKEDEMRRKRYNDQLKEKLQKHQQERYMEQVERQEDDKRMMEMNKQKDRVRRQYFEQQKKNIVGYREQKRRTDELLLIPTNQQRNLFYNQFPSPKRAVQAFKFNSEQPSQPLSSIGMISAAGQQYIKSGQGLIEQANPNKKREQYQAQQEADYNEDEQNEEDDDGYYDETDGQQQQQQQQQEYRSQPTGKKDSLDLVSQ